MSRNLWLVVLWALHCSLCVWVLLQLSKHLSFCICMYFCFSNKWHIKRLTHHTAVLVLSHLTKSDWLVSPLLHIFFFFFNCLNHFVLFALILFETVSPFQASDLRHNATLLFSYTKPKTVSCPWIPHLSREGRVQTKP